MRNKPIVWSISHSRVQCTEGWDRGLGISGLKYFFPKMVSGDPLVTLEGIPPWNPQESLSGGRYSFRKSAWRWKMGSKWVKIQLIFFALKISNMCSQLIKKLTIMKKSSSYVLKNLPKVVFNPFLFCRKCVSFHCFLSLSAFKWQQLISAISCKLLEVAQGFWGIFVGGLHWLGTCKSSPKFFLVW